MGAVLSASISDAEDPWAEPRTNHLFLEIILKNARRDSVGVIPDSKILIQGEASVWIEKENEAITCLVGGFILSDWGIYPVLAGGLSCPGGVSCPIGGCAADRRFPVPSPTLSGRLLTLARQYRRLGETPTLFGDGLLHSILSDWGVGSGVSCPDLTMQDRSGKL